MEELRKKAINYAEENFNEVMKEAFAKVYADGFRDGYKDCEEERLVNLCDGKTEYVDLGLPSGTLWSSDYERVDGSMLFLTYDKAAQQNLPTKEQCEELVRFCRFSISSGPVFECIGPNGNYIRFCSTGYIRTERNTVYKNKAFFWHVDDNDAFDNNNSFKIDKDGYSIQTKIGNCFIGYKLPIRLVKYEEQS